MYNSGMYRPGMYNSGYSGMQNTYGSYGSYGMNNNINNPQQNPQNNPNNNPDQNQRRRFFQDYFKMMGGMRSILQLGFASVAMYNFGSKSLQLFKKIFTFLLSMSKKFLQFISQFIPIDILKNILIKSTGSSSNLKWGNVAMSVLRVMILGFMAASYFIRKNIKEEIIKQHEQLNKKAEEIQQKKQILNKNMEKYIKQEGKL